MAGYRPELVRPARPMQAPPARAKFSTRLVCRCGQAEYVVCAGQAFGGKVLEEGTSVRGADVLLDQEQRAHSHATAQHL